MSEFIQHLCLLDMFRTSPVHHQERFVQAVFADFVCGNTRTARHVQPLQRNGWTCRVVRTVVPHNKSANTACTKRSWWWTGKVRNISSKHKCWINSLIKTLCVSCWTAYICVWCRVLLYYCHIKLQIATAFVRKEAQPPYSTFIWLTKRIWNPAYGFCLEERVHYLYLIQSVES